MGQGDDRLPGASKMMADIAIVPHILMARLRSASYKNNNLTGATLEMEILYQCGESTLRDFKPSCKNHVKGSVVGQLTPVKHNRLTVSETVLLSEPDGRYMEIRRLMQRQPLPYCTPTRWHCGDIATQICLVYDGTDDARVRFGRKKKFERSEGALDNAFKRPGDL